MMSALFPSYHLIFLFFFTFIIIILDQVVSKYVPNSVALQAVTHSLISGD